MGIVDHLYAKALLRFGNSEDNAARWIRARCSHDSLTPLGYIGEFDIPSTSTIRRLIKNGFLPLPLGIQQIMQLPEEYSKFKEIVKDWADI